MASTSTVRVVVYDSRIDAWNLPGGMVHDYVEHKVDRTLFFARFAAPRRTGNLTFHLRRDIRTLRSGVVARVRSTAPYSVFVHEGTTGPIYPHGDFLWVPKTPYISYRVRRESVAGQRAQPFLRDGLALAMAEPYRHLG